jgi:cysteine desulfuration protein SufE
MTIEEADAQIIAEFAVHSDWLARYEYLIALGRQNAPTDHSLRTDVHALPGCQAQVWIRAELLDGKLSFQADSDSLITRGILALLLRAFNGHTPADVTGAKLRFPHEVGLTDHLSPARANGLATILSHIRQCAASYADHNQRV